MILLKSSGKYNVHTVQTSSKMKKCLEIINANQKRNITSNAELKNTQSQTMLQLQ